LLPARIVVNDHAPAERERERERACVREKSIKNTLTDHYNQRDKGTDRTKQKVVSAQTQMDQPIKRQKKKDSRGGVCDAAAGSDGNARVEGRAVAR
jgi:hypothetical protein